jgi:hypothetical protein
MRGITRLTLTLGLLLFSSGFPGCEPFRHENKTGQEKEQLMDKLKLVLRAEPDGSGKKSVVRLLITNSGKVPITWDMSFSVFLKWRAYYEDHIPVAVAQRWDVDRPTANEIDNRLVSLGAGETASKTIDLDSEIRCFGSGTIHFKDLRHGGSIGAEYLLRFKFDDSHRSAMIEVDYKISPTDKAGFRAWTGRDVKEYSFYDGNASSNSLRISLEGGGGATK